jgi:hypothetical protein
MARQTDATLEQLASSLLENFHQLQAEGSPQCRERIVQAAKRIIAEVAEPMDQVKESRVTVRRTTPTDHNMLTSPSR